MNNSGIIVGSYMILFLVHMDGVLVRPQAAGEAVDKMLTQDAFGVQQLHGLEMTRCRNGSPLWKVTICYRKSQFHQFLIGKSTMKRQFSIASSLFTGGYPAVKGFPKPS